jgi:hypothetical protein
MTGIKPGTPELSHLGRCDSIAQSAQPHDGNVTAVTSAWAQSEAA